MRSTSSLVRVMVVAVVAVLAPVVQSQQPSLNVPATNGIVSIPFSLDAAVGGGGEFVNSFNMSSGTGTLILVNRTFVVMAYQYQDWVSAGQQLYDLFGVSTDGQQMGVFYLYTNLAPAASATDATVIGPASGGVSPMPLTAMWYESFTLPMQTDTQTSGTVSGAGTAPSKFSVSFPALTGPIPDRTAYTLAATGPGLSINSKSGSITLTTTTSSTASGGQNYSVLPFSSVDCSACGGGGWYELHSLLTNANNNEACFLILYFEFEDTTHVLADYGLCLPSLDAPTSLTYELVGEWTGGLGVGAFKPPLPSLMKPPRRR